jgi:hypothetical protein
LPAAMMATAVGVAAAIADGRFVPFRVRFEGDFFIGFKYTACDNPSQGSSLVRMSLSFSSNPCLSHCSIKHLMLPGMRLRPRQKTVTFVQCCAYSGNIAASSRIPICKDFMDLAVGASSWSGTATAQYRSGLSPVPVVRDRGVRSEKQGGAFVLSSQKTQSWSQSEAQKALESRTWLGAGLRLRAADRSRRSWTETGF